MSNSFPIGRTGINPLTNWLEDEPEAQSQAPSALPELPITDADAARKRELDWMAAMRRAQVEEKWRQMERANGTRPTQHVSGSSGGYRVSVEWTTAELGLRGTRPARVVVSEEAIERKVLAALGFDINNPATVRKLQELLRTDKSPLSVIHLKDAATGRPLADCVAVRTERGTYRLELMVEKELWDDLKLRAGKTRTQIEPSGSAISIKSGGPSTSAAAPIGSQAATSPAIEPTSERSSEPEMHETKPASAEPKMSEEERQRLREEGLDIAQAILDLVGIFDPTGAADGVNFCISVARGNYFDAAVSAMGLVPYIGDLGKLIRSKKFSIALGKLQEYEKQPEKMEKLIDAAPELESALDWALDNIKKGGRIEAEDYKKREKLREGIEKLVDQHAKEDGLKVLEPRLVEELPVVKSKLKGLGSQRNELIEKFDDLIGRHLRPGETLLQKNTLDSLDKAKKALDNNLRDSEMVGALRDAHGLPVKREDREFNHSKEVEEALGSLKNLEEALAAEMERLREKMNRCSPETDEYRTLESGYNALDDTVKHIEGFIKSVNEFTQVGVRR